MRRVDVGGAVLVAVLMSGCVPQAPVTPSPSAPTFMCTPEAGGVKAPCSEQQYQQMKAKDALYAEAEQVYRTYLAEYHKVAEQGGARELPNSIRILLSNDDLAKNIERDLRDFLAQGISVRGTGVVIRNVRREPTRTMNGSELAIRFCGDATGTRVYRNGKRDGSGAISYETAYFRKVSNSLRIVAIQYQGVSKCGG